MKKVLVLLFITLLTFLAEESISGDVLLGTETAWEKRETGDYSLLPMAYFLFSGSHFPSERLSFFADVSGRGGYDTADSAAPYDFSLSLSSSFRGEGIFFGLGFSSRIFDDYQSPREWHTILEGIASWDLPDVSIFLRPRLSSILGAVDSLSFGLEPGANFFVFSALVSSFSVSGEYLRYSDGSRGYALRPRLSLDWYPPLPLNLSVRGGWSRIVGAAGNPLEDSWTGAADLLWYLRGNCVLSFSFPMERTYFNETDLDVLTIEPHAGLRLTLPDFLGGVDLLVKGGLSLTRYEMEKEWTRAWSLSMGVEKQF